MEYLIDGAKGAGCILKNVLHAQILKGELLVLVFYYEKTNDDIYAAGGNVGECYGSDDGFFF